MSLSSPLGTFFADDGGFEAALANYVRSIEESIVVCMAAEGFKYSPRLPTVDTAKESQNELSTRAWTLKYGYGISTSSVRLRRVTDPNEAHLSSISADERDRWLQTLTGSIDSQPQDSTPLDELGCRGAAISSSGTENAFDGLRSFGSDYSQRQDTIVDRIEMVNAIEAWSRCMSKLGYPNFDNLEAPKESINAEIERLIAPFQQTPSDEEQQAFNDGDSTNPADFPDLEGLHELQAHEITVATADLTCYEQQVQAIYEPLRNTFENELLAEYGPHLSTITNIEN